MQHPAILSVFEAGDSGPYSYYSIEYVDGVNLAAYIAARRAVDDPLALQLIRVAAEGFAYLDEHAISHVPLDASSLYVDATRRPRLANPATQSASHPDPRREIAILSQIVAQLLPGGQATDPALQSLLQRMAMPGVEGFSSWNALLQAVKALEPKVMPAGAFKMSAQDVAAIQAVDHARRPEETHDLSHVIYRVGSPFSLRCLPNAGGSSSTASGTWTRRSGFPPASSSIKNGEKLNLPAFSIDRYEVTIGQYARFLGYLKTHPDEAAKFEHPSQKRGKSHIPKDWDTIYRRCELHACEKSRVECHPGRS